MGCDEKVSEIDHLLWPVVGILEDGTEVQFQYDEVNEDDYCINELNCDCSRCS